MGNYGLDCFLLIRLVRQNGRVIALAVNAVTDGTHAPGWNVPLAALDTLGARDVLAGFVDFPKSEGIVAEIVYLPAKTSSD